MRLLSFGLALLIALSTAAFPVAVSYGHQWGAPHHAHEATFSHADAAFSGSHNPVDGAAAEEDHVHLATNVPEGARDTGGSSTRGLGACCDMSSCHSALIFAAGETFSAEPSPIVHTSAMSSPGPAIRSARIDRPPRSV